MDSELNNLKLRVLAVALLAEANTRSAEVQRAISNVSGNPTLQARLADVAARLAGNASQLAAALDAPGSTLREVDISAIAQNINAGDIQGLLADAAAAAQSPAALAQTVASASADTRGEAQSLAHDMFDQRIFDPYLHFSSAEDEEAYRKRQAAAQQYINAQLARGTPEGNLNAGGGMIGSLLDADAHGAGDSPQFMPRWNALTEKTERQRAAMRAAGQSTEEFDRNLDASVRSFLKAKGLSDADIETLMAKSANPLDAAKPFLRDDSNSRRLETKLQPAARMERAASTPVAHVEATAEPMAAADVPLTLNPDAMSAKLKAAGLRIPDSSTDSAADVASGHGLPPHVRDGKGGAALGG